MYPSIQLKVIPGAYHAFDSHHIGGSRMDNQGSIMQFSASATQKTEELTKAFFAKYL